ncbi:MAG: hypothetical protein U1E45_07320 [Geminicoccaceae bacterium]
MATYSSLRRMLAWLADLGFDPRPVALAPARPTTRRPRRRRVARGPRDHQRTRVYRWEAEHVLPQAPQPLDLDQCRSLVEAAYRWREKPGLLQTDWKPPTVSDGRGRRHACGSREVIKLPRWARTVPVVLHECAHGMAPDKHGPQFVAAYVDLVVEFMGLDRECLLTTLQAAGIEVATGPKRRSRRDS